MADKPRSCSSLRALEFWSDRRDSYYSLDQHQYTQTDCLKSTHVDVIQYVYQNDAG